MEKKKTTEGSKKLNAEEGDNTGNRIVESKIIKQENVGQKPSKYRELRKVVKSGTPSTLRDDKKVFEEITAIWGSAARAAKFLKKRDGNGGGNFAKMEEKTPQSQVPYNIQRESLKTLVKKCSQTPSKPNYGANQESDQFVQEEPTEKVY